MSVRQSVQALVLSALQASDASSSEAAQALNSLLEAEKSLLPEIASQLRRSNQITEDVFNLLLSGQKEQDQINEQEQSLSNTNHQQQVEEFSRIEKENREKLTKYFEDVVAELEKQNGELHSELALEQSKPRVSLEQHSRALAELEESQKQVSKLYETLSSAKKKEEEENSNSEDKKNQQQQDDSPLKEMMMMSSSSSSNNNASSSFFPQPGWTKDAWFKAYEQLEQNIKKMISKEDAEKLQGDLSDWKNRASNAINRVACLETDVNSLRFTNGVLQEQLSNLIVFSEKQNMLMSMKQQQQQENNNNTTLIAIPSEIQNILRLNNNNNNNNNNALTTNALLSNNAVNAAFRTVEVASDFSSRTVHHNNDESSEVLSRNQIPLGAFSFDTVKQLVERFTELSQALYVQELDDSVDEKRQLLDKQKRHRSEDDANENNNSKNFSSSSSGAKVTETRSVQTEAVSHQHHRHSSHNQNRYSADDAAANNNDDDDLSSSDDVDFDAVSTLQIDSDPEIFNALRQITLNFESGFASASQSESQLLNARLMANRVEIDSLKKQLESAKTTLTQWEHRCHAAENREHTSQELINRLQSDLRQQSALEVQVPMMREVPGILTRFEAVLATISKNAEIDKDENAAKVIAGDNMKRHVESLEHLFGRLQNQYDAFAQLSSSSSQNNNNTNTSSNSNNNSNSNIQQLQSRISDLEKELQTQSQDLETERTRTIEQLERMYQAEEQSRQLRNEMRDLRATALSAEQAQVLRDEIDRLETRNNQVMNGANQIETELNQQLSRITSERDNLQRQVTEAENKARTFEQETSKARQERTRAAAELNTAYAEVTKLSRQLQDSTNEVNTMTSEISDLHGQVSTLRTALLSEATVRDEFARLFPGDGAGIEALNRVDHLNKELKAQDENVRELAEAKRELTNQLSTLRDQLQESESQRVTSTMRAATAEASLKKLQERAENDAAAAASELSFLRQDCQRLTAERDAALERSELLVKHVDTLSQDQLSASARLYGLSETRSFQAQMQEMNTRNETLQTQLEEAQHTISDRDSQLRANEIKLREENDRVADLQGQLSVAKETEVTLRENISTIESSLATTISKLDDANTSLKEVTQSRNDLSNEIVTLEHNIKNLKEENGQLSQDKSKLQDRVEELKRDVEDRDQLVAVAREAVASGSGGSSASVVRATTTTTTNTSSRFGQQQQQQQSNTSSGGGILGRFTSAVTSTFGGGK